LATLWKSPLLSEAVSNAVVGNVVERKAIMELPLNGRNPLNP
jgi:hypothetical protein